MSEQYEKMAEQAAAFQKIWSESMTRVMQTAFTTGPATPPPEILKQIRGGIFEALAKSWDDFMRTPQFTEAMKQWMDNAVHFRRMTNEFMGKVRNEMQAASRDDIDTIIQSVRHMEKRLLDRIDALSAEVASLQAAKKSAQKSRNGKAPATRRRKKGAL
jgi:hypothetical protein